MVDEFRSFCSSFRDLRRPSEELVEAAFDGDVDTVQLELDKGYFVDSAEGHGYTALSEAAVQGRTEVMRSVRSTQYTVPTTQYSSMYSSPLTYVRSYARTYVSGTAYARWLGHTLKPTNRKGKPVLLTATTKA